MMRSMLADQPYSPVTSTHGESARRLETMTLSTLSSSTSFMSLHRPSLAALASSNSFFSSSVSSILRPSFVAEMSFLPSYSLSCCTAYSSIGSTMYSTSIPFFLRRSRNGEFSTARFDWEAELRARGLAERQRRKQAHLQRVGEDMKRRAILKDRKRIESKVSEAMEMARRSKLKRQRIFWFRRMENLSKIAINADNLQDALGTDLAGAGTTVGATNSGVLLSRNVSVPFLLRQLGGAKSFPSQRSRRLPIVDNVQRDILESSYDILPEDEPRFDPAPADGLSPRERANQLYGGFSEEEKLALLEQKLDMLRRQRQLNDESGKR